MKLNNIVLTLAMGLAIAGNASAAATPGGSGTVTFKGSIIDAPCSITPDTVDQTVKLGDISNTDLTDADKTSTPRPFTIKLENCDVSTMSSVGIEFTGAPDSKDATLLGITGTAKGAGIVIADGSNIPIKLGTQSTGQKIQAGDNTLLFSAYLKADSSTASDIIPGEFSSIADFTLYYQ